jgi:hypothetical protein
MDVGMASLAAMFGGDYNPRSAERAQKATERLSAVLAEKDARKALGMVPSIPLPAMRALALARIARSLGGKDPEAARGTLSKCMSLIEDLKEPGDRYVGWLPAAETAHELKDDQIAWDALEHAMAEVKTFYRQDVENDNRAMRGFWPSTQSCRLAAWRAAKLMGARAEALLDGIGDPGLTVVARIEIARALLEKPLTEASIEFVHVSK